MTPDSLAPRGLSGPAGAGSSPRTPWEMTGASCGRSPGWPGAGSEERLAPVAQRDFPGTGQGWTWKRRRTWTWTGWSDGRGEMPDMPESIPGSDPGICPDCSQVAESAGAERPAGRRRRTRNEEFQEKGIGISIKDRRPGRKCAVRLADSNILLYVCRLPPSARPRKWTSAWRSWSLRPLRADEFNAHLTAHILVEQPAPTPAD